MSLQFRRVPVSKTMGVGNYLVGSDVMFRTRVVWNYHPLSLVRGIRGFGLGPEGGVIYIHTPAIVNGTE